MRILLSLIFIISALSSYAQDVYRTPSGTKYHLASCRMVENVSVKLSSAELESTGLEPCKICKPPALSTAYNISTTNKAAGAGVTLQCKGKTKAGNRCKHKTSIANGFCYQHTAQAPSAHNSVISPATLSKSSPVTSSGTCGAKNKTGGYCKRKVKDGGRCYQH